MPRFATDTSSSLTPVASLSKRARTVFNLAVDGHPHLRPCDATLLTLYAQCAARVLAGRGDPRQREKLSRLLLAFGRALRLHGVYVPKKPPKRRDLALQQEAADAVAP
jgi:hypothetical protein